MKQALAMIETKGFVAAMEAADAALKSASVELLGWKKVGGGLVAIFFTG
ncbi:MAG: BMC domain-containing protein, partial [Opitutales bacterium]|nr:BMC domain-containing protein [Opitutales bacterium]